MHGKMQPARAHDMQVVIKDAIPGGGESVRRRFTPQKKASRGAAPARAAGRSRRRAVALSAVRSGHDAPHRGQKKKVNPQWRTRL